MFPDEQHGSSPAPAARGEGPARTRCAPSRTCPSTEVSNALELRFAVSSLPLPARIASSWTPRTPAAATRNSSAIGCGYCRSASRVTKRMASITRWLGGHGLSFVCSLAPNTVDVFT
jgi:hypothetical protein